MRVENQKKIRVAINGFGRIGRNFLRCWEGRENSLLDVVAINDSGGVKQASHLLKYDSTLGKFDAEVKVVDDKTLAVNGKNIAVRAHTHTHTHTLPPPPQHNDPCAVGTRTAALPAAPAPALPPHPVVCPTTLLAGARHPCPPPNVPCLLAPLPHAH